MRRLLLLAGLVLATSAFAVSGALAGSPHFVSNAVTATRTDNSLTVSGKEAGLGDEAQVHIVVTRHRRVHQPRRAIIRKR